MYRLHALQALDTTTTLFNNIRTLKFEGWPTNAFFAAVNQMFGGSSQLTITADHCFIVWIVHNDLITMCSAVVVSWEDLPNIWLMVAKMAFVGWALNFRLNVLLKGTVLSKVFEINLLFKFAFYVVILVDLTLMKICHTSNHLLLYMHVSPSSVFSSWYLNLNQKRLLNFFFCCFSFFKVGIDIAKLDGIIDDLDFTEKLISEQSVFCLPGKVKYGKFLRILNWYSSNQC